MKNKKLIALAGVTLTTAVMLTGCGNNDVKTYDKEQMNVNISEITESNNVRGVNDLKAEDSNENSTIKEQAKLNISDKNLIYIVCEIEDFTDGQKLSADEYLQAVYNSINEFRIDVGQKEEGILTYTETEINNIVKSIFGVNLPENKSWGAVFTYDEGTYTLERSDRGMTRLDIRNIETDVVADTRYVTYDLYSIDEIEERYHGKYVISISNQDNIVKSKQIQK